MKANAFDHSAMTYHDPGHIHSRNEWTGPGRSAHLSILCNDALGAAVFKRVKELTHDLHRSRDAVLLISEYFHCFIIQPGAVEWTRENLLSGPYWESLVRIAENHLASPGDSATNIHIFNALGSWYSVRSGHFRNAFSWYQKTLQIMPGNTDAIDGLISLYL